MTSFVAGPSIAECRSARVDGPLIFLERLDDQALEVPAHALEEVRQNCSFG